MLGSDGFHAVVFRSRRVNERTRPSRSLNKIFVRDSPLPFLRVGFLSREKSKWNGTQRIKNHLSVSPVKYFVYATANGKFKNRSNRTREIHWISVHSNEIIHLLPPCTASSNLCVISSWKCYFPLAHPGEASRIPVTRSNFWTLFKFHSFRGAKIWLQPERKLCWGTTLTLSQKKCTWPAQKNFTRKLFWGAVSSSFRNFFYSYTSLVRSKTCLARQCVPIRFLQK